MSSALGFPIGTYGLVLFFVFVQSTGIPFPGAMVVVPIAAYTATSSDLSILLVLACACGGGVMGGLCGFWVGRRYGAGLLLRYGRHIGLNENQLKVTTYLYDRYGRGAILFGCVFAQWIIPLAGITNRSWRRVLPILVAGPIIWAVLFCLGGYVFGAGFHLVRGSQAVVLGGIALLGLFWALGVVGRSVKTLSNRAEPTDCGPVAGQSGP